MPPQIRLRVAVLSGLFSLPLAAVASKAERSELVHDCRPGTPGSSICIGDRPFLLAYKKHGHTISIRSSTGEKILHRIDNGYEPELVGADREIAFLPASLQPYGARQILLYTSAQRSTGGDGRGQCGSGVERFLHALDVSTKTPRLLSSVLIASCSKDIYLYESESDADNFSIVDGQLRIKFLTYPGLDASPATGELSNDFKSLLFTAPGV
jgi:hypothetical protein